MGTPHSATFHVDAHLDTGDTAEEAALVAEDKRRRNTSASGMLFLGLHDIVTLNVDNYLSQVSDQEKAENTQPRTNRLRSIR